MDKLSRFNNALSRLTNTSYLSAEITHPSVNLGRENYQVCAYIPEESFNNRFACIKVAGTRLHEYYIDASAHFAACIDPLSATGFFVRFRAHLSERVETLRNLLQECRTEENTKEIDMALDLLTPDEVCRRMDTVNEALKNRYTLPTEETYKQKILYETCDPSEHEDNPATWLIAKCFVRHGFDLLEAIHHLEQDATKQIRAFKNDFDAQAALEIDRLIVAPIKRILQL